MRNLFIFLLLSIHILPFSNLFAQNPPIIGIIDNDTLIVNSGSNYLIIPEISDGDGTNQDITVTALSQANNILEVDSVAYGKGNTFAVVYVSVKDIPGTATLEIEATDDDGSALETLDVHVGNYNKPGINFSIHDIVFWQEVNPLSEPSVFDTIVSSSEGPYDVLNWDQIPNTVGAGCGSEVCVGHDFMTCMLKGYLVPPANGEYTFYMKGADDRALWLSENANYEDADIVIYQGNQDVGTVSGDEKASEPISLEAGKVYAIYGVQWMIHTYYGGILWEGPGIDKDYIDGQYLMYVYDNEFPGPPSNLEVLNTGIEDIRIGWQAGFDNKKVIGYNIFVNGRKVNNQPVTELVYQIENITPATKYSIAVNTIDEMGNESLLSNTVTQTTYSEDNDPPQAPINLVVDVQTGLALQLSWDEPIDLETEIRGYLLYVDGELYNIEDYLYDNSVIVKGLAPETSYNISIKSVDAAFNESDLSEIFPVSTGVFDPFGPDLGVQRARMQIEPENISWNEGIGINTGFINPANISGRQREIIEELKPGIVRWGTLTANPMSFEANTGTASENITIADWMNFAIELDVYCGFTCGVKDGIDWRTDPQTFANFLEYLGGPSSTTWGAVRAAEGYSDPLLPQCKGLIFEFGNEVWGGNSHDAEIGEGNYEEYGQWCRDMAEVMKNSPYWDAERINLVYSSRYVNPEDDWRSDSKTLLTGDTGQIDWFAVTGYLHGNLTYDPEIPEWDSELDFYKTMMVHGFAHNIEGLVATMQMMVSLTGGIKPTYFYESNLTTPSYNGRLGQAIVMTDYMATAMEHGGALPTIFHLTGGQWRITEPENDYRKLPLYWDAWLFNTFCKGHVMKVNTLTNGVIASPDGEIPEDFAPVGCHAYYNGENFSLLLSSRDFENDYTIQIDLPDEMNFAGTATKYLVTGDHYSTKDAVIDTSQIELTDSSLIVVPKYSAIYLVFNGDDPGFDQLPLAHFPLEKPDSIVIVPQEEDFTITTIRGTSKFDYQYYPTDKKFWPPYWETISTNLETSTYTTNNNETYLVRAPAACDIEGEVVIRANAAGYTDIFDELTVTINIPCETGLRDLSDPESINVYPNPVSHSLSLKQRSDQIKSIYITDTHGRTVMKLSSGQVKGEINVQELQNGMYFLIVEGKKGKAIIKFIKQ